MWGWGEGTDIIPEAAVRMGCTGKERDARNIGETTKVAQVEAGRGSCPAAVVVEEGAGVQISAGGEPC